MKNVLNYTQRKFIDGHLQQVCRIISEGLCKYNPGWNDQRVAEEMSFPCTTANVASIRNEVYGSVQSGSTGGKNYLELSERIEKLEARLNDIEAWLPK